METTEAQPAQCRLLRFDGPHLNPSRAGDMARVSPETAVRWAKRHGVAYQAGGPGSPWRIHPVGWHLVVEGDLETLEDLRNGRLTPALKAAYQERALPLPASFREGV